MFFGLYSSWFRIFYFGLVSGVYLGVIYRLYFSSFRVSLGCFCNVDLQFFSVALRFFPARLNHFLRFGKVCFDLVAFLSRMFEADLGLVHFLFRVYLGFVFGLV
jgi:hypothetical protein